ncbi:SMP-30/gluconolactonase/LRE family protein [Rhizobium etli]|nr:SMP-30/gluconolactonase/LRE family protein [Rhizobium etli]
MKLQIVIQRSSKAVAALAAIFVTAFALMVQSSDFRPATWIPGPHSQGARNEDLSGARPVAQEILSGPEDVAVDSRGRVFTGTVDGIIWRADLTAGTPRFERFASVGGRPLGLVIGANDLLYVANHGMGLQAVSPDGEVSSLLTEVAGTPILFANDLAMDVDGIIYLSDSSSRYNVSTIGVQGTYGVPDLLEGRPFGRVIRFDTRSRVASVLATGLYFPNGIAISRDSRSIVVAETNRYRLSRIWLDAPRTGERETLVDNLKGSADGLTGIGDGRMLLAAYHRSLVLDESVLPSWLMRHVIARLPNSIFTRNAPDGFICVIDDQTGEVLQEFHGGTEEAAAPANAVLWNGELFIGTLFASAVTRIELPIALPFTQTSAN